MDARAGRRLARRWNRRGTVPHPDASEHRSRREGRRLRRVDHKDGRPTCAAIGAIHRLAAPIVRCAQIVRVTVIESVKLLEMFDSHKTPTEHLRQFVVPILGDRSTEYLA